MFTSTNNISYTFGMVILLFLLLFFLKSIVFFFQNFSSVFICSSKKEKKRKKERETNVPTWSLTAFPIKTAEKKKHFALCTYPNKC